MVKNILAIIAGYIAMALIVALGLTAAYQIMGVETVFQAGTYDVSSSWIAVSVIVSLLAALTGGYVSMMLAKNFNVAAGLAALILILGLFTAFHSPEREEAAIAERPDEVSTSQAMMNAREPTWVSFLNPIIGALGVLGGAHFRAKKSN